MLSTAALVQAADGKDADAGGGFPESFDWSALQLPGPLQVAAVPVPVSGRSGVSYKVYKLTINACRNSDSDSYEFLGLKFWHGDQRIKVSWAMNLQVRMHCCC